LGIPLSLNVGLRPAQPSSKLKVRVIAGLTQPMCWRHRIVCITRDKGHLLLAKIN
jgi:hypothetical protein